MRLWEELVTTDFDDLAATRALAVLPVAAIEQHGPHLPLGTDAFLCDAILDRAATLITRPEEVVRLPTQRVGLSPEHGSFPGTLTMEPGTLLAAWTEIGLSVAATGIRKLVIFNTHGGQGGLVDMTAQVLRRRADLLVARCSSYRFALPDGLVSADERRYGLHGGLIETSMMLAAAPHLVRRQAQRNFTSRAVDWETTIEGLQVEGEAGIGWCAEDLNAEGATGDAASATSELGDRLLTHYASKLATVIDAVRALTLTPTS